MKFEFLHPADQLVMMMDRIYLNGMTTTSGGNLSIKDENGDIWITPAGVDKGTLSTEDIVCVKADGSIVGKHKPSSEFPFHRSTYRQRPDIKAVLHAHPPSLVSFSIVRKLPDTRLTLSANLICGEVGMAEYGLPGSDDLGEKIAKVFQQGINIVLLENHGVVAVGEDLMSAFMAFETLDFCAKLEINAHRIGNPISLSPEQIEKIKNAPCAERKEFVPKKLSTDERKARKELCELVRRSYDQKLFTSTQGSFSARLSKDSFIITPNAGDRKLLDESEILKIDDERTQSGKIPDFFVSLHREIYQLHPHINSVIIAVPPNMMAFAVTGEPFDSRTIPESYILLRNIPKVPFEYLLTQPAVIAGKFTKSCPLSLVENGFMIATGSSPLNAFDRLEVAEYSATALIASKVLGSVVAINDSQVKELETAFHLD